METIEAIHTRRSIRNYTDRPLSDEQIEVLLRAAMAAPSAGNQQPWQFVVIDERELLTKIQSFHPYSAMLKRAPMAILICGDLAAEKHKGYWVQDCSAAAQNLLLAAHGSGLGAVWLGVHPCEDRVAGMRDLLRIPDDKVPFALVAVGHPAEEKGRADRYDTAKVR
ncbi:unnamed protein product, partial [marine sediment metagenome]